MFYGGNLFDVVEPMLSFVYGYTKKEAKRFGKSNDEKNITPSYNMQEKIKNETDEEKYNK